MKISFNKKAAQAAGSALNEGRHVGIVCQIVGLGEQPGYKAGETPYPAVGVVIQTKDGLIAKRMRISESPLSSLFAFLDAALPDPDAFDGDDALPLALGRPVAIEVVSKGQFSSIDSFHRLEVFESGDVPTVSKAELIYLEGAEDLTGENGKALFQKLHRDIRSWLSKRVRG